LLKIKGFKALKRPTGTKLGKKVKKNNAGNVAEWLKNE
jgi:hypothetical protein